MNRLNTKTHIGSRILHFVLCISLMLLSGCAEGPDSSDEASSDTGSIAFSLAWEGATNEESAVIQQAQFDCVGNGVDTVEATVYDQSNNSLRSGGPWPCTQGEGRITGVQAGSNRRVVVLGIDSNEYTVYRGEQAGIRVTAGQTTQAQIIMYSVLYDYWVDASQGSDVNPGTQAEPFKTITHALTVAVDGDIVSVSPGTYDDANGESFPLTIPDGVSLIGDETNKGYGGTPTQIFGGGQVAGGPGVGAAIDLGANSVVAGFVIINTNAGLSFPDGIVILESGVTVRNNTILNNDAGIYIFNNADNHTISGNIIQMNDLGLGFIQGGVGSLVQNNEIRHNSLGVEYDAAGGDLGGGSAGSTGGNIISCNTRNDLWTSSGAGAITITAHNNYWDHAPNPTVGGDGGGVDIYNGPSADIQTTGAQLASSPCS